jgi:hypothetical protein
MSQDLLPKGTTTGGLPLQQIATPGPDESVREDTSYMLESYKQHNIG